MQRRGELGLIKSEQQFLILCSLLLQLDKYKNISKASEERLAALELRNKELLATVSSSPTRGEICSEDCRIGLSCVHTVRIVS